MKDIGDGILMMRDGNYCKLVNPETGKERELSSHDGYLLFDDSEIDFDAIWKTYGHGKGQDKSIRYGLHLYSHFKNGICALSWTIYPDGMWFADSDGYGMEDNKEEKTYCIINRDFEILMPFKPVKDIEKTLKSYQKDISMPELETRPEYSHEENKNILQVEPKEIEAVSYGKLGKEEKEYIRAMESGVIEIHNGSGIEIQDLIEIKEEIDSPIEFEYDDPTVFLPDIEPEKPAKKEPDWEIKEGENVLIYLGRHDDSDSWWELEFESDAFRGPRVWNPDMGDFEIFKLKSLKKGYFTIYVMRMRFEPYYSPFDCSKNEYYEAYNHDVPKIQEEFTVEVRVL